jgi:hypothetical protein
MLGIRCQRGFKVADRGERETNKLYLPGFGALSADAKGVERWGTLVFEVAMWCLFDSEHPAKLRGLCSQSWRLQFPVLTMDLKNRESGASSLPILWRLGNKMSGVRGISPVVVDRASD